MSNTSWTIILAPLLALLLVAPAAGSIAVGLHAAQGIRIQEYMDSEGHHYCVHNARPESVALVFREVWYGEERSEQLGNGSLVRMSPGRQCNGDTLAMLALAPKEFAYIPAVDAVDGRLVQVLANGTSIGLVSNADPPDLGGQGPVVLAASLDHPGRYREGLWTERASLWVSSGQDFTVDLVLQRDIGVVHIGRTGFWGSPPGRFVSPKSITCETLVFTSQPEKYVISTSGPSVEGRRHRVKLHFQAPQVDSPSLFYYWGYHWIVQGKNGYPFYRAVLVCP